MTNGETTRRALLRGVVAAGGVAAASGSATGQQGDTVTYGDWFTGESKGGAVDNYDGTTVDERGSTSVTVEVGSEGNGGPYAFGPPAMRIDPGTTVTFEWVSDTHNIVVESQPGDGGWAGHEPIENTGFSYEHTFETEGVHLYYCQPHLPLGMKAAVVVGDAELVADTGGDAGVTWTWPGGDIGVAFMGLLFGTVGLVVLLMAGGEGASALGRWRKAAAEAASSPLAEAEPEAPTTELGHDDFDPVGTAALIVLYFLILVVMWVFVYFVEFLGNGPTVIG